MVIRRHHPARPAAITLQISRRIHIPWWGPSPDWSLRHQTSQSHRRRASPKNARWPPRLELIPQHLVLRLSSHCAVSIHRRRRRIHPPLQ
uniref:Uncharacterized protein n=1 Tax=Leersia perrieri TaxID=77586 RepID=A0A0D9VY55_9ORYZ